MKQHIETWTIDGKINLTSIAIENQWHLASVVDALEKTGVTHQDAIAFANFIFSEAEQRGESSSDFLTEEQWSRLS